MSNKNNQEQQRNPSILTRFLWWCAGIDQDVMKNCPHEWAKYASMGGTVLFTGMFAQPDKPSFSIFTVKGTTITVDSYTANPDGSADKFNSFVVKRVKEHTPFTGLENVVVDQIPQTNGVAKILYNGQILLVKDGVAYDVLGQVIVNK